VKNVTKKLSGVTLGLMIVGGSVGLVQADVFNATATVSSSISLVETTALDLGSIYVTASDSLDGTGTAGTLRLATSGTTTVTDGAATVSSNGAVFSAGHVSKFVALGTPVNGVITVTGAAPFGTVTVTHGTLTALTHSSANPALPTILFSSLTTSPANGATVSLDASGDGAITVGGLFTAQAGQVAYADGTYTGTYEINVAY